MRTSIATDRPLGVVALALLCGSIGAPLLGCVPESFSFSPAPGAGGGGAGGVGGGHAGPCAPQETQACYAGPMGTLGVGACKSGTAVCLMDGSGFGACDGQVVPSFDDCATPADEDCDGAAPACTGAASWVQSWGDDMGQRAYAVAVDAEGNSVVVGELAGSLGIGMLTSMGLTDVFAVKLDPAGGLLWARRWGDAAAQSATGVAIDEANGDIYVTGVFAGSVNFGTGALLSAGSNDVFVVKLDKTGTVIWSKAFGDVDKQTARDIAVRDGRVAVTGSFAGSIDFATGSALVSGGLDDGFLAVLSAADGAGVWSIGFGDAAFQSATRARFGPSGSVYMAGYGAGTADFGDGLRVSAGMSDAYLVKFTGDGSVVWSKLIGGVGEDQGLALGITSDEGVVISGSSTGTIDFGGGPTSLGGTTDTFIARYEKSGVYTWARRAGTDSMKVNGLAVDGANNLIVTGIVTGAFDFGGGPVAGHADVDGFAAKLSPAGDERWSVNFGSASSAERGNDVCAGPKGEAFVVGYFDSKLVFPGASPLTSAGGYDAFVAKLAP